MAQQSQDEMIFTQTALILAEIDSMVLFPGEYQLVRVIMMYRVANPNMMWNSDQL